MAQHRDGPRNELGEFLRGLRVKSGKSQRQLAQDVGVGFPHLSKIENGAETPSDDLLEKLAATLGANLDELMVLAQRVPTELAETILDHDYARAFLRHVRDGAISETEVRKLIVRADKKR